MKKVKELLEIDKILSKFKRFLKTEKGLSILNSVSLSNDPKYILKEYSKLLECQKVIETYNDIPLGSALNMEKEIENLLKGEVMDGQKLNLLKDEISICIDINKYYQKIKLPNLKQINIIFSSIKPNLKLYEKILRTISNDGQIVDDATPELRVLRKKIREIDKNIRNEILAILSKNKEKINGDNYVIRNGHLVLPVLSSSKSSIQGVIHDISDSGATTFIEPYIISELENEKNVLFLKERDEITKILESFRTEILFDRRQLILNNNVIGELDVLSAKYKYMKFYNANVPEISLDKTFQLLNAKHPLLDENTVVGNDFIFGKDKTMLLISGPNAGGKTIALKTIASLSYMVKLALPINADEGSIIPIFNNIYIDIGDNQSIESNLSTFSSQISNISYILKNITSKDLVVFDELCNGTDPKEGEAISIAISKFLIEKTCLCAISSHYQLLKKFGMENEHIISASFLFDERKIRPTFKIMLGISGKSYGFLIANKYGIPEEIISEAKTIYEDNYLKDEDRKIQMLEEKETELRQKEDRLKSFEKSLSKEQSKIDIEKNKIKIRTEKLNQNKSDEFDKYLDQKYKEINEIYKSFLEDKNSKKALKKLSKISINDSIELDLKIGDLVKVKKLEISGRITAINGNKYVINTDDGLTINTSLDSLIKLSGPSIERVTKNNIDKQIFEKIDVPSSLNLIGYRGYEGVEAMKDYLAKALADGKKSVKIIHGFGTGRLRQAIWEELKKNPIVDSFSLCDDSNGAGGATRVVLKNE